LTANACPLRDWLDFDYCTGAQEATQISDLTRPLLPVSEWLLDPGVTFLDHGSISIVPRSLFAAQGHLQEQMERNRAQSLTLI
jgi:hypothetical protein